LAYAQASETMHIPHTIDFVHIDIEQLSAIFFILFFFSILSEFLCCVFYSLPGGFDRFPRCGFFFCYSRLMVIPWVHLFTELPPFFLYDFIFPARGNEDPLFLYGV
jgi:hypothetical protein